LQAQKKVTLKTNQNRKKTMKKDVIIKVDSNRFRTIKDPFGRHDMAFALVRIGDLPADLPLEINPRSQNTESRVSRQIEETLTEDSENFALFNRGITVTASEATYDNKKNLLTLRFPNERHYGVIDGGHTFQVIQKNKAAAQTEEGDENGKAHKEPEFFNSFVRLEILTGIKRTDLIADVARARNTSAQVKEESLANLQGKFDWIKESINTAEKGQPASYANKIAWRENEDSDEMPIGVREIIGFATMFHPMYEDSDNAPTIAYQSKGRCLEMFVGVNLTAADAEKIEAGYQRLHKILPDVLRLYDYVHQQMEKHYRTIGGFSGISGEEQKGNKVKLGKVVEVKHYKDGFPLYYLNETAEFKFPDGWVYPIVAALRALCSYKGSGAVKWKADPFTYFDKYGKKLVELTLETSRALGRNPNAVGKNKPHWVNLHDKVLTKYLTLTGADSEKEVRL
jgi:hypothetical protein